MDRSPSFGSTAHDSDARFALAFAAAPGRTPLNLAAYGNSPAHYAKGTPSPACPEGHRAPTACRLLVSGTISLPSQGYFSPFPHGTGSLSVVGEYLALEGGPPRFPRGFTCPVVLGIPRGRFRVSLTGLSPSLARRPSRFCYPSTSHSEVPQPRPQRRRFGLFPFRSPLLRESRLISLPPGTEMFQFPGCRLSRLFDSPGDDRVLPGRVAPFGDPRIKAC
jgi:hypothetical protein